MHLLTEGGAAAPPLPADADRTGQAATWTVEPGDSLWRIAEQTLARTWRRAPHDTEIDPYWRRVVEMNRHRLSDPSNPDLIFPGQVFDVPAPPAPPSAG
jgi:nucleoid-associated protein YgaU